MKFHFFIIADGQLVFPGINKNLDTVSRLEFGRLVLHQLRGGQEVVQYGANGADGLAPFAYDVRLGVPPNLRRVIQLKAGQFFALSFPNATRPYQVGLVMPKSPKSDADKQQTDKLAIIQMLGLSAFDAFGERGLQDDAARDAQIARDTDFLWAHRPFVATNFWNSPDSTEVHTKFGVEFAQAFGAALLTEDEEDVAARAARGVEYVRNGPVSDLILAVNQYISTGDHVGEGQAYQTDNEREWIISVPFRPSDRVDSRDFELLKLRLAEIQNENGPRVTWLTNLGADIEGLRPAAFSIRRDRVESLTKHLMAKPSKRGWGSPKPTVDIALAGGAIKQ